MMVVLSAKNEPRPSTELRPVVSRQCGGVKQITNHQSPIVNELVRERLHAALV